jgi:tetratricopeptide (TPR) repeat protein
MKNLSFDKIKKINLINAGIMYEKKGNYEKMIKYYKEAIDKYKNVEAMYRLGKYYYLKKQFGKMLINLLMAIEKKDTKSMILLSNYSKEKDDIDNFIRYSDMAIELDDPNAMYLRGIYYLKQKKYDDMIKYWNLAVEKNYVNAMIELGHYFNSVKDYKNMEKYFLMAIQQNNSEAMYELGNYYEDSGNYEMMEKYFLLAAIHGEVEAMLDLGSYYYKKKKLYRAVKFYNMAIVKKSAEAMYRMGTICYRPFEKNKLALKYFLMCIKNDNIHSDAYWMAGIIYLENGILKKAEKMFLTGINLEHKDCYYYYSSILCYKIKKDFENAIKYALLSLDKFEDLRNCITLGDYNKKIKDYDKMKQYYLMCIENENENKKDYEDYNNKNAINECKDKLANYYEYIENDYEKANYYYTEKERKKINLKIKNFQCVIEKCSKSENKECNICDNLNNVNNDIFQLNCCSQDICKKCMCGILNSYTHFRCPYCRKETELENNENNHYETQSDDRNYINGIYYEDDI